MTDTDKERQEQADKDAAARRAEERKREDEQAQREQTQREQQQRQSQEQESVTDETTQVLVEGRRVGPGAAGRPVRQYKLKAGHTHIADGHYVKAGDAVYLNEQQAKAFRDKFDPVDEKGEFKLVKDATYRPSATKPVAPATTGRRGRDVRDSKEEVVDAPQGPAPQSPVVGPGIGPSRMMGAQRDPNSPPDDPTALEPERQGQRSRLRGER